MILDEPNSNLDARGEQALTGAIDAVRARGGIAIVIAHRPSAVRAVDHVMILNEGRVQAFGARDKILGNQMPQPQAPRSRRDVGAEHVMRRKQISEYWAAAARWSNAACRDAAPAGAR